MLITIAIPVFTTQLENSREATDAANLRSAYAEVSAAALTGDSTKLSIDVPATQETNTWDNTSIAGGKIGALPVSGIAAQTSGNSWTVAWDSDANAVAITPTV